MSDNVELSAEELKKVTGGAGRPIEHANGTYDARLNIYTTKLGDTLHDIAARLGVSFWSLREANESVFTGDFDQIPDGLKLRIP